MSRCLQSICKLHTSRCTLRYTQTEDYFNRVLINGCNM